MDKRKEIISRYMGEIVRVEVDRPIGFHHGKVIYPINYGYIPGLMAGDGEEQDVYILGVEEPVSHFCGQVIAAVVRKNDREDKLVVAPVGRNYHREQIAKAVAFQEQYFDSFVVTMPHEQLQNEILTCISSKTLKKGIASLNYIFTEEELLGIAFRYAPNFEERLRLMQVLADHGTVVSHHAAKCILWQKDCLVRFKSHTCGEIYELRIKTDPDAYEERYLCSSYEAALKTIDGFYKEYEVAKESPYATYTVEKRKILTGKNFEEGRLGECDLSAGKTLVSVYPFHPESEFGPCPSDCLECCNTCVSTMEIYFPSCIADRAPVRFHEGDGKMQYGIHLNADPSGKLSEYYIIPFESTLLKNDNYDEDWECHGHRHVPIQYGEEIPVEELPGELRKQYDSFTLWLKEHFTEGYKRRRENRESTT